MLFNGVLKYVNMHPKGLHFEVDWDEIEKQCTDKTKYILLNSPHNPTGKLFHEKDFEKLDKILQKYPRINIISDEVYEMVCFEKEFPRIAKYNNMWDRVISVFSGGKTFSCTGWRVGWAIGPESIINELKEC